MTLIVAKAPSLDIDRIRHKYEFATVPWGPLGYVVYKRTYARMVEGEERTEEWWETIFRAINGVQKIRPGFLTEDEMYELYHYMFTMKGLFSGRALWQLGTALVDKGYGDSLCNCWAVSLNAPRAFCFIFEELMLGGGVGYSVRAEDVYQLPKVRHSVNIVRKDVDDADYIVPDSREGWVSLLRRVLKSYFHNGRSFSYSLHCLRSAGAPIKGFGGSASGPEILEQMIQKIGAVLKNRAGRRLLPIDALDLSNVIGECVVAGNVRRSAQISLGDQYDIEFLKAKRWDLGDIPNHRSMSNNTVYCTDTRSLPPEFWEGYMGNGECYGLVNPKLIQSRGVLREGFNPDAATLVNPCAEIPLEPYECCNLSELVLPNLNGDVRLASRVAQLLFKCNKAITCMDWLWKDTRETIARNRRIGVSVTGMCQNHGFSGSNLYTVYRNLVEYDKYISAEWGIPESIRHTTVQPSGTKSLLHGSLPGVHPAYSEYYIRRVRMSSDDVLVKTCRDLGYNVESVIGFDGSPDHRTVVVEFPCQTPEGSVLAENMTAIKQLEMAEIAQTHWADNSVSVTVYFEEKELPGIKKWLAENYPKGLKTVSFLRRQDHGFKQAPYEEITKEAYKEMKAQVQEVSRVSGVTYTEELEECAGGHCPIR